MIKQYSVVVLRNTAQLSCCQDHQHNTTQRRPYDDDNDERKLNKLSLPSAPRPCVASRFIFFLFFLLIRVGNSDIFRAQPWMRKCRSGWLCPHPPTAKTGGRRGRQTNLERRLWIDRPIDRLRTGISYRWYNDVRVAEGGRE